MNPACTVARWVMPTYADRPVPVLFRRHEAKCLRCQAESAAYRSLTRGLGRLGEIRFAAPPSVAPAVAAAISGTRRRAPFAARPRVEWRTAAAATGVLVALAGALTFVLRHRAHPVG